MVTRATGRESSPNNAAVMAQVVVLPLVPVMPTLKSELAQGGAAGGGRTTVMRPCPSVLLALRELAAIVPHVGHLA